MRYSILKEQMTMYSSEKLCLLTDIEIGINEKGRHNLFVTFEDKRKFITVKKSVIVYLTLNMKKLLLNL